MKPARPGVTNPAPGESGVASVCAGPDWEPGRGVCGACSGELSGRQQWFCSDACAAEWRDNHWWTNARDRAVRDAGETCSRTDCPPTDRLEVNHIDPRRGRGYGSGCHHHQANLEVLCHGHHVEVTAEQRASDREAR